MTFSNQTTDDLLAATSRRLSEQGYDIIREPNRYMLPDSLQEYRPGAIAIGRDPKLVIEIARARPADAERIARLQQALRELPGWELYLVLDRASDNPELARITDDEIAPILDRVLAVSQVDTRAALLVSWAALEALGRQRRPNDFSRPQSPGRIVEKLAFEGIIVPADAAFLRSMAERRNAFAHGDLRQTVSSDQIARFVDLLRELTASAALQSEPGEVESA